MRAVQCSCFIISHPVLENVGLFNKNMTLLNKCHRSYGITWMSAPMTDFKFSIVLSVAQRGTNSFFFHS